MADLPGYWFYTDVYKGNVLSADEFDRLAVRAADFLLPYEAVAQVIYFASDGRNKAICAIADELSHGQAAAQQQEIGDIKMPGAITSISIGSVSASIKAPNTEDIQKTEKSRCIAALKRYARIYQGGVWAQ